LARDYVRVVFDPVETRDHESNKVVLVSVFMHRSRE